MLNIFFSQISLTEFSEFKYSLVLLSLNFVQWNPIYALVNARNEDYILFNNSSWTMIASKLKWLVFYLSGYLNGSKNGLVCTCNSLYNLNEASWIKPWIAHSNACDVEIHLHAWVFNPQYQLHGISLLSWTVLLAFKEHLRQYSNWIRIWRS